VILVEKLNTSRVTWAVFIGSLFAVSGILLYVIAAVFGLLRVFLRGVIPREMVEFALWYSPIPIFLGVVIIAFGLLKVIKKRAGRQLTKQSFPSENLVVALTAYNDEQSIGIAVKDFLNHVSVAKVIVISNNSSDGTMACAEEAGAIVFNETEQGYGACVKRAMTESLALDTQGAVVISEGDCTFEANDLNKMLPYLEHSDIVNGTRIVETLQANSTQLSIFMHYGNLFVAKLLELKYFSDVSLTDVGTTYKIIRSDCLLEILDDLDVSVNLAFNPYFMETAISKGYKLVEVPITFHQRIGESKGGNVSDVIALKLGLKMMFGIIFGWKHAK
jgi:hypothetical protein